jgi:alcohol dehydrogenase class IV
MEFNLPLAKDRYAEIAKIAGVEEKNNEAAARELIRMIKFLSSSLNIPSFKELGIKESQFPEIARKSFENNSNPSNPREAGVEDYLAILKKAAEA